MKRRRLKLFPTIFKAFHFLKVFILILLLSFAHRNFWYLNERLGQPTEQIHKEEDVKSYREKVGENYGKRGQ